MMKTLLLIIFLLGLIETPTAQQLPSHNEFQELGLSFDIPFGWQGQLSDSSVLLGHNSISGLMVLTENTAKNATQLKTLAMEGLTDEGVQLTPSDEFRVVANNRVEGFYQGQFNGAQVKVYAIGLINGLGNGMNIIIMTETDKFTQQHQQEANKLAKSVKFFKSIDSNATQNWKNKITGTQLKYFNTSTFSGGSGISDRTTIDLCNNGQFIYYSNSHASFDSSGGYGSANNQNNNQGSYAIKTLGTQSYLQLTFTNAEVYEYALSTNQQNNTFLDDSRYLIADLESCY